jgi:hypothetical protein
MLARDHMSAAILNLGFDLLEYEQVLLQLKQLSFLCQVHLEQLLEIRGEQQQMLVQHLEQQVQP